MPEQQAHNAGEPGVQVLPCAVCEADVSLASDAPPEEVENPLCILHFFAADPSEEWEAE